MIDAVELFTAGVFGFVGGLLGAWVSETRRRRSQRHRDVREELPSLDVATSHAIDVAANEWASRSGQPQDGPIAARYAKLALRLRSQRDLRR